MWRDFPTGNGPPTKRRKTPSDLSEKPSALSLRIFGPKPELPVMKVFFKKMQMNFY